jgi:hypothetical protein
MNDVAKFCHFMLPDTKGIRDVIKKLGEKATIKWRK